MRTGIGVNTALCSGIIPIHAALVQVSFEPPIRTFLLIELHLHVQICEVFLKVNVVILIGV